MQDQENQAIPNPEEAQPAAQTQQQAPQQETPFESAATPSLEEQLSVTEAKLAEMHDAFMRAKADADNIRRRAQEDVSKAHKFAVESFAEALLPVKDSLEMALKVETPSIESLKEGVEMTLKQLNSAFERNRLLEVVPAAGDKLDPNRHQAVAMVPAEQEANTVVAVLQKGYTIADRLLRPAIVTAAQPK
ncbi:nucleotide exchange factor GrpE [Massilia dura]|uniref:Protein GrpE n=1 Tax=Pseudoduganella dura TaxID=321982 RepID=A0A6I3XEF3_9BURK|nr:nucleotide exchange factor GrpE [Pseudoduganella dura]MUI13976.1 nucleotide exchange factor GrpE [Pseudoduganella dura]GGX98722.1 protein GrpE [Pseudoduganella dura]